MEEARRPARALVHPLWWAALLLLVLNDHGLKSAGWLPGALTGKLSDVAGLIVAPALLATLLRCRTRRALALAHGAVGAGFAAINLWPAAAAAVEWATALTPFPWRITVDPTDLLALPALLGSWALLVPAMERRRPGLRRPLEVGTVLAGAVACLGTSPPDEPVYPSWHADLLIGNGTSQTLVLRLRPLKESVRIDCAAVAAAPSAVLRPELFATAAVTWEVEPGRTVPARGTGDPATLEEAPCYAYLLEGGGLARTLLFWQAADYPLLDVSSRLEAADPARVVAIDESDGPVTTAPHEAAFVPAFVAGERPTEPPCLVPDASGGVDWSEPLPLGTRVIESVAMGADGCHVVTLRAQASGAEQRLYLCAPLAALPFAADEELTVARLSRGQSLRAIEGIEVFGATARLRLGRGDDVVPFGEGSIDVAPLEGCGRMLDGCGDWLVPLSVDVRDAAGQLLTPLTAGADVAVGGGTLTLLRAFDLPVADTECLPLAVDHERVLESVWVGPAPGAGTEEGEP